MKYSFFGLLILLFTLTACNDDDDKSGSSGQTDPPTFSSGSVSATMNGASFSSDEVTARFRSSGGFFIIATDPSDRTLKFTIQNFIGNAGYTVGPGLGTNCIFRDIVNGQVVPFTNGVGSLDITEYDAVEGTFKAEFILAFTSAIDPSIFIDGQGSFDNLKIAKISEPSEGKVVIFRNDQEFYNDYEGQARVSNLEVLEVVFSGEDVFSTDLHVYMDDVSDPETVYYTDGGWGYISDSEIMSWEYDEEMSTISGHLKSTDVGDYEVWFSKIPVVKLHEFNLEIGEVLFYNGQDTLIFTEALYDVEPGETFFYKFEATNDQQQKLQFEATESGVFDPNWVFTGLGRAVTLRYFSNENSSFPSATYNGRFSTRLLNGMPDKRTVYFESNDEMVFMRANAVDYDG